MPITRSKFSDPLLVLPIKHDEMYAGVHNALFPRERLLIKAQAKRLPALFAHYDIDANDEGAWLNLAWELATDFVPGFQEFQEAKRRGRKPKGINAGKDVRAAVNELLRRRPGFSVEAACLHLVKKNEPFEGKKWKTVRRDFYRQNGRRVEIMNALCPPQQSAKKKK